MTKRIIDGNTWWEFENNSKNEFQRVVKDFFEVNQDIDIQEIAGKLPKSNTIRRDQAIKNLNEAYANEKLVLVIGAGVSMPFGVASWNGLLQNLMVYTIEKENKVSSVLSKLFNIIFSPNPLIAGRYLQNYFDSNNSSFESMVRDVLYSSVDKNKPSELLDEIVRLCVAPGKRHIVTGKQIGRAHV